MKKNLLIAFVLLAVVSVPNISLCAEEANLPDTSHGEDIKALNYRIDILEADNYSMMVISTCLNRRNEILELRKKHGHTAKGKLLTELSSQFDQLAYRVMDTHKPRSMEELERMRDERIKLRRDIVLKYKQIDTLLYEMSK